MIPSDLTAPDAAFGPEPEGTSPPWSERALALLRVAATRGTGVPLEDLLLALPADAPQTVRELATSLLSELPEVVAVGGIVYLSARSVTSPDVVRERQHRAEERIAAATQFVSIGLGRASPWVRCAAVTGSTAFRDARAQDDCDLFIETARGTLWAFLCLTFARLRLGLVPSSRDSARWCLNYIVDSAEASEVFRGSRGYQFAREALVARVVAGPTAFRTLLRLAPWMEEELPRLYHQRIAAGAPTSAGSPRVPLLPRLLNPVLFVLAASYLQAAGLVRNRALRRAGRPERVFRTCTGPSRLTYESREYRELAAVYEGAPVGVGSTDPAVLSGRSTVQ